MGNRPSSEIIYGFGYVDESDGDESDFDYDHDDAWRERCAEIEGATTWVEKRAALAKYGERVRWGSLDDPSYAFGFVFASGDWDAAEQIDPASFVAPDGAEEKIAALCEFFGVKPRPLKWLMLSSYG